ncbi:hypothetical protein KQX54_012467 [Cotesia glomerata]|uniref:Uncharacterized protein n=1 Tax=Cotesia glomerata TaxID=32391 RepID=A0AAV7IH05_COTGL|nr:hypothetical protein KQX54_012467 [Cotesia glomerata]
MSNTNHRQAVLAGSQSMSGECQPGTYSDVYVLGLYAQLYKGPAKKLIEVDDQLDVFLLTTEDITFVVAQKGEIEVCGHSVITTDHPKLHVIVIKSSDYALPIETIETEDMDIFAYINN